MVFPLAPPNTPIFSFLFIVQPFLCAVPIFAFVAQLLHQIISDKAEFFMHFSHEKIGVILGISTNKNHTKNLKNYFNPRGDVV